MKKIITLSSIFLCLSISAQEYTIGEAVDLGLSVKWASCNVGATSPEEHGDYYAWGEIEKKDDYSKENYKWYDSSTNSFTKRRLKPEDDVAHVKWGGGWRMPTYKEIKELMKKCHWEYDRIVGKPTGYKVTGPNGNSIFLPFPGYREGTKGIFTSDMFFYWSTDLEGKDGKRFARCLSSIAIIVYNFDKHYGTPKLKKIKFLNNQERFFGCTVRPVIK